jgi:hypothetical protein
MLLAAIAVPIPRRFLLVSEQCNLGRKITAFGARMMVGYWLGIGIGN